MTNLVLYRKYRPKTFSEVVGQEHVVQTLTNAITMGIISHAYLFTGPRGSGKTTIARLLAKSLNCENRKDGFEPCNECSSCNEVNEARAIDLIEVDAASNRGIDEIRELRDGIRFAPTKSKYKVFIIDEAHQLSKDAANALLKTLEEPPSHAIFILATTEIHKMIPTIISRCQRFDFRKLSFPEIISRLEWIINKEKVQIDRTALELIALNSSGSVRDAEALLDQVLAFGGKTAQDIKELLGMVDNTVVGQFVDYLCQGQVGPAIEFLNKTMEKGKDPQEFSKTLVNYLRQGMILKMGPELANPILTGLTGEEKSKLCSQVANFQDNELRRILKLFLEAENKIKYSPIPQLPIELAIIESLQNEEK
ncbi:MAG: DNA polymerase III subunit gamma/tau [Candidatus Nealsonbacteria bacterium]|nr:DNA polymerase III subunit gamma/tau [Candidatus Nealsonbacteria bacterium]